jgi:hypothetical protein
MFSEWADCWGADRERIYDICKSANYPYIGLLLSAGTLAEIKRITGAHEVSDVAYYFQYVLAFFDACNFIFLVLIARALQIRYAVIISLVIIALPSSWVGGALWGQIDGISQFFLLSTVFCLIEAIQSSSLRRTIRSISFFFVALLTLGAAVLTKQLTIFSAIGLVPLALLAFANLWSLSKLHKFGAIGSVFIAVALFVVVDTRLAVHGYLGSSYLFVWLGGGSTHGAVISGNGFNIWTLLNRSMSSSSGVPFYCANLFAKEICLTPQHSGLIMYGLYMLLLGTLFWVLSWHALMPLGLRDQTQGNFVIVCFIVFLAQANLGFNVFLTGTHERYLYHCFPFLILASFFFLQQSSLLSWRSASFYLATAVVYGVFVASILHPLPAWLSLLRSHKFVALVNLALLLNLLFLSLRLAEYVRRMRSPGLRIQDRQIGQSA